MPHSLDQLLPSLQSLGVWSYWLLALFAMLEAVVLTGIVAPGALAVIAGGILVQRGAIDFFDLAWFVAAGTALGSEISYRLGRLARAGLVGRRRLATSAHAERAKAMLHRYGGFAMVIGRFFGPLSAFVPFAAAMADMRHRRFTLWNLASAVPYALVLPAIGYFFGSAFGRFGAAAPRIALFALAVLAVLALLWVLFARLRRALPFLGGLVASVASAVAAYPPVRRLAARHPSAAGFLARRFDTSHPSGLTATVLAALFVYLFGVYLDSVYDFLGDTAVTDADTRLANLIYAFRDPRLITVFAWITAFGGWKVIVVILLAVTAALAALRRRGLILALWATVIGNQITVTLLKIGFGRPRSGLGYFIETSNSFPSGHAAASAAIWGLLFYIAWRTRLLSGLAAGLAAITVAFLIGLSRVYLVEHYVSDVVNGWLVGGLWLIVGISLAEWLRLRDRPVPDRRGQRLGGAALIAGLVGALLVAALSSPAISPAPEQVQATVADPATLWRSPDFQRRTTSVTGGRRGHIAVLAAAQDEAALTAAFRAAGWHPAAALSPALLAGAFWADWRDAPAPAGLVLPTFWQKRPDDLAFERRDGTLQVRVWRTDNITDGGARLYALTVEPPQTGDSPPEEPAAAARTLLRDLEATGLRIWAVPPPQV
ncbi:MAG: phosphatase PAP2 family protein [Tranquillimonas sp.]